METYTDLKEFVVNPDFQVQRRESLEQLSESKIDRPIVDIVHRINELPYCFTLQSCYGHFVHDGQKDPHGLEPLSVDADIKRVTYRIAYVALCLENHALGKGLFDDFQKMAATDPENIQFCCATWFWKRQVNSYVLQVEPLRYKHKDQVTIDYREALLLEKVRNEFFVRLKEKLYMK